MQNTEELAAESEPTWPPTDLATSLARWEDFRAIDIGEKYEIWEVQGVPPKNRKADRPNARTSKLTYEEIRERRSGGESLESIAQAAELSRERVRQICKA